MSTRRRTMKVGTLARRTGLTVRALHYYEEVGLLRPARTPHGHRRYGAADVERLQQVQSLRAIGLPLGEIGALLDDEAPSLAEVVERHRAHVAAQAADWQMLLQRLDALTRQLRTAGAVSIDDLLTTIQVTTMHETYYTSEQLAHLEERRRPIGEQRIREVEQAWVDLFADVQAAVEAGTDPSALAAQRLVERWDALVAVFTDGDAGIERSLGRMYEQEGPQAASRGMVEPAVWDFVQAARAVNG